jgi:hypothetical protein
LALKPPNEFAKRLIASRGQQCYFEFVKTAVTVRMVAHVHCFFHGTIFGGNVVVMEHMAKAAGRNFRGRRHVVGQAARFRNGPNLNVECSETNPGKPHEHKIIPPNKVFSDGRPFAVYENL